MDGPPRSFSRKQIRDAVRLKLVSFEDFLEHIQSDADEKQDVKFLMHIDRLLRYLFVREGEGTSIGKMTACKLIPAAHLDTCKKYLAEAEARDIIVMTPRYDAADTRKTNVRLTPSFARFIEKKARQKLAAALKIAGVE